MSLTHEEWLMIMQSQGGYLTPQQDRQILADYRRLEARANTPLEAHAEAGELIDALRGALTTAPAPTDALREALRIVLANADPSPSGDDVIVKGADFQGLHDAYVEYAALAAKEGER